jgi:tetratricopeptide (TPR) repeat protein
MKKVLVTFVLALAGAGLAYGSPQPSATSADDAQTQTAQPSGTPGTPTNQKVIKDPAEYNSYIAALNTQDPVQKAAAMEAFVKQYPQSIVLTEALEQEMAAYQQAGNGEQVEATAKRLLQLMPNNIRALAIIVALDRAKATNGDQAALKESCTYAKTGLQQLPAWQKPESMGDAEFKRVNSQMSDIFNGAAGFCALQAKDYAGARSFYEKAVQIDPTNLQDVYQLALADLESTPMEIKGLWYCSKAINIAQQNASARQAVPAMTNYCKSKYRKYHGTNDGWDQVVAAATQNTLPADFNVTPAPTAQELACKVVQDNDPSTLSASDWEYVLQYRDSGAPCNKDAADKVWAAIQAKQKDEKGETAKLKVPVKVISSTADTVEAALTEDNQQANKADLHIVMAKPLAKPPAPGATIEIVGNISEYTPNPFMFTMTGGELPAAKPPARKGPARKTATKKG